MQPMIPDSEIHLGHRERMRRKLLTHGGDIFEGYELMEMLLYNIIPVRDTNPVAKRLMFRFGSLEGILSAEISELLEVEGVGKTTAEYIRSIGALPEILGRGNGSQRILDSYEAIGRHLCDYFAGMTEYKVIMLLFDNSMHIIGTEEVYSSDYDRGNVHGKAFLDLALAAGASCAVIAHNHPYGPLYPSHADILTNGLVSSVFLHGGVKLLEHFIISGEGYIGINGMTPTHNKKDELSRELDLAIEAAESRREDFGL